MLFQQRTFDWIDETLAEAAASKPEPGRAAPSLR